MPVKRTIQQPDGIFFVTITCYQWCSLLQEVNGYDIVYKWFNHLKLKGHYINGYVIMPNHIHVLLAFRNTGQSINTIIGNGKRFMAYEIVKRLHLQGSKKLLHQLQGAVEGKDRERNKKHEVWADSFDWKECRIHQFIKQKLDYIYIYNNPIRGKWNLTIDVTQYQHSSAIFYLYGQQGVYPVTNYFELADIDLSNRI